MSNSTLGTQLLLRMQNCVSNNVIEYMICYLRNYISCARASNKKTILFSLKIRSDKYTIYADSIRDGNTCYHTEEFLRSGLTVFGNRQLDLCFDTDTLMSNIINGLSDGYIHVPVSRIQLRSGKISAKYIDGGAIEYESLKVEATGYFGKKRNKRQKNPPKLDLSFTMRYYSESLFKIEYDRRFKPSLF